MGVYIKGMEMPKRCGECPCFHAENPMYCQAVKADKNKKIIAPYGKPRPDWCPLIPVPPHGRLIDEDEVRRLIAEMIPVAKDIINSKAILEWVAEYLPQCHAVIEAEEGE